MNFLTTATIFVAISCTFAHPTGRVARDVSDDETVTTYLANFGYTTAGALTSLSSALMHFQKFAGLEETGVADVPTVQKMAQPRCGNSDPQATDRKKRQSNIAKWDFTHVTYSLHTVNGIYTSDMTNAQVETEIDRAFKVWSDVSALTFERLSDDNKNNANIEILFGDGAHLSNNDIPANYDQAFDGPGGVLAHAFFPNVGDAHLDDAETFTFNTSYGTNLFMVAAHEFGHSLGLDHSSVQSALMAPFYTGYQSNFQLDSDDIDEIVMRYGANTNTGTGGNDNGNTDNGNDDNNDTGDNNDNGDDEDPTYTMCDSGVVDAIEYAFGVTHIFQGNYYVSRTSSSISDPALISTVWNGLQGPIDDLILDGRFLHIFKDDKVYKFNSNKELQNRGEAELVGDWMTGLPSNLDAVWRWSGNNRLYFAKGGQYYRKHASANRVDDGYPKALSVWWSYSGAEHADDLSTIGAAFEYVNGKTYFFTEERYYKFWDSQFKTYSYYPRNVGEWWLGCTSSSSNLQMETNSTDEVTSGEDDVIVDEMDQMNGAITTHSPTLTLFSSFVLLCLSLVV